MDAPAFHFSALADGAMQAATAPAGAPQAATPPAGALQVTPLPADAWSAVQVPPPPAVAAQQAPLPVAAALQVRLARKAVAARELDAFRIERRLRPGAANALPEVFAGLLPAVADGCAAVVRRPPRPGLW